MMSASRLQSWIIARTISDLRFCINRFYTSHLYTGCTAQQFRSRSFLLMHPHASDDRFTES
jgi:hypothetical protein